MGGKRKHFSSKQKKTWEVEVCREAQDEWEFFYTLIDFDHWRG